MAVDCPVSGSGELEGCAAQDLKVRLPGGPTLQVMVPNICPSGLQIAKNLLTQANAALAPLAPIFNIIDALLAVKDFAEAVPGLLTDPGALIEAIAKLIEKISALAQLIPQLSIPFLIVDLIDVIIAVLDGVITELAKIVEQELKIAAAGLRAAEPGNASLIPIVECATDLNIQLKLQLGQGLAPLNSLFGVLNLFLGLIGAPEIPPLDDLPEDASEAIESLTVVVEALQKARDAIPIP